MNRVSKIAALSVVVLLTSAMPVFAQASKDAAGSASAETPTVAASPAGGVSFLKGAAFGAGLIMIGAAYGIGKIGSCAVESMARQPEVANSIQTAMIITAAMLEGVTLFALIVCIVEATLSR